MEDNLFACFELGKMELPGGSVDFAVLPWNPHPAFAGVFLKHLVTSAASEGRFSYHLVRIDPGKAIGDHMHDPQLETHEVVGGGGTCRNDGRDFAYRPGVVSVFQPRTRHEVTAGREGLLLFAKFMPPLC